MKTLKTASINKFNLKNLEKMNSRDLFYEVKELTGKTSKELGQKSVFSVISDLQACGEHELIKKYQ